MVERIGASARSDEIPNVYSVVNEMNYVHHFLFELQSGMSDAICYLEFPHAGRRIDALAILDNCVLLIEAKSYVKPKTITGSGGIEEQAARLENKKTSLRKYICDRIIKTSDSNWNTKHDIKQIWSVLLAAAWDNQWSDWWKNVGNRSNLFITDEQIPVLATYKGFIVISNPTHTKGPEPWFHLLAYKKIADISDFCT